MRHAVVLAAGHGSRIWPYNEVRNKCAIPIGNVPMVRRVVDALCTMGIREIAIVVGPHAASIRYALRGSPADTRFVEQAEPEGTAPAVLAAAKAWDEPFIVVHGDLVTAPENLARLRDAALDGAPPAVALVAPVGRDWPHDWIIAHVEGEVLRGIEGHARGGEWRLAGAYMLTPEALPFLRDHPGLVARVPEGGMPPVEADLSQSLQMMADEGLTVRAVRAGEFLVDVDKPWHILEANERLLGYMADRVKESVIPASARVHDGAEIEGHIVLEEGATIGNRVVLRGCVWVGREASITNGAIVNGPALFGAGTRVRDYCQVGTATMGDRGIIGHAAEFSGVAFDTVYMYHYCEIWGVLGSAVDIGAATVCGTLRFDDRVTAHRIKGRRELPLTVLANATFFGDYCRTGVNVIPMPGCKVGAYSCVGPGVVIHEDIPSRTLVLQSQELTTRDWGPERYGW